MKQLILIALTILTISVFNSQAQTKSSATKKPDQVKVDSIKTPADTTITFSMNVNLYRQLLYTLDQNIDSKKVSREILEFLQKIAQIKQPADNPKK